MLGQAQVIAEEYKHVLARLSDKKLLNLLSAIYIEKLSEATPGQIFELISEETLNSSQGQLVSYESESPCSKPSSGGLLICTFSKRLVKQINGTMYSMNISSNSFMNSFNFSICADSKPDTYYELMAGKPLCYFSKINARLTKRLLTKKPVMLDGQDILKSQIQILAEFLSRRSAGRCKEAIQENFQLHIQTSNL